MPVAKPKSEESEPYKTPGVPEDVNRNIPEELEELFGESLPQESLDDSVFDNLAKEREEPKLELEPEPEVKIDEESSEELPEEEGKKTEEVTESRDTNTEAIEKESETPEEIVEETPDDQLKKAQRANALLIAKINDGYYSPAEAEIPTQSVPQQTQEQPIIQTPSKMVPVPDFKVTVEGITEDKFQEIQTDKEAFNDYIQDAVQRGVQSVQLQTVEIVQQSNFVNQQIAAFAKDPKNADILPLIKRVTTEAQKLDASMPEASIQEVLAKAADKVRNEFAEILTLTEVQKKEILKTKKEAAKIKAKPQIPKFAKGTGAREVAVTPEKISAAEQNVLDEVSELFDGSMETDSRYVY